MKPLLPLLLLASLSACGLRPVYGGGSHGAVAQALGQVEVQPIQGKGGWLVRNALNDRLAFRRRRHARATDPARALPAYRRHHRRAGSGRYRRIRRRH